MPADRTEDAGSTVAGKALATAWRVGLLLVIGIALTALVLPLGWAIGVWLGGIALVLLVAAVMPVRTGGLTAQPDPTPDHATAVQRFARLDDLDSLPHESAPEGLHPKAVSRLWDHGKRTPAAVVLLHGLSNSPGSMVALGPRLHALGLNVVAVRLPQHGHADLATDALKRLRAADLRRCADTAVDVAAGLGERVTVVGISAGGVVAAWLGQNRPEVARTVLVAPAFGLSSFGGRLNRFLMRVTLLVPSFSLWKDPKLKADFPGLGHNYKRQHTRAVGEVERLGLATFRQAATAGPATSEAVVVTNAADQAVDNSMTAEFTATWESHIPVTTYEFDASFGLGHEIIDPADPEGDVERTYPVLLPLITQDLADGQPSDSSTSPDSPEPSDRRG